MTYFIAKDYKLIDELPGIFASQFASTSRPNITIL